MPDTDACLVRGCTRTRRWGASANVKRYCVECTRRVWRTGGEPVLDSRGTVVIGPDGQDRTASGPKGAERMVLAQCA